MREYHETGLCKLKETLQFKGQSSVRFETQAVYAVFLLFLRKLSIYFSEGVHCGVGSELNS